MALTPCPECGHQVSDTAASCPSCGYRSATGVEQNKKQGGCLSGCFTLFAIVWLIGTIGQCLDDSSSSDSSSASAVTSCKEECREGYEKYRDNPAFGQEYASKIYRECKTECERNPNF